MSKPRLGDVVEVEWLDSQQITLGWSERREYVKAVQRPQTFRTAGYWIKGGDHILICLSVDPTNGHMTQAMSVPARVVRSTRVLSRAHKRVRKALR